MLNLKKKILEIFSEAKHEKSVEAEANLILFYTFRNVYPVIEKISDLMNEKASTRFPISSNIENEALRMAKLRVKGIPLQHITNNQFFFEHDYEVNQHVLIPRPETEILMSQVINYIRGRWKTGAFRFAELGLGSGIISTEILFHFKNAVGLASEISPQAIAVARYNIDRILGVGNWEERFSILEPAENSVGFEVFSGYRPVDLIVSNPPYVSVDDEIEDEVLKHEPHLALFPITGGVNLTEKENPNFFYESFLFHHQKILKPDGIAFFEIPHERAEPIKHQFENAGFINISIIPDLTGRARLLIAQK